jgi:hypothetical protein
MVPTEPEVLLVHFSFELRQNKHKYCAKPESWPEKGYYCKCATVNVFFQHNLRSLCTFCAGNAMTRTRMCCVGVLCTANQEFFGDSRSIYNKWLDGNSRYLDQVSIGTMAPKSRVGLYRSACLKRSCSAVLTQKSAFEDFFGIWSRKRCSYLGRTVTTSYA